MSPRHRAVSVGMTPQECHEVNRMVADLGTDKAKSLLGVGNETLRALRGPTGRVSEQTAARVRAVLEARR